MDNLFYAIKDFFSLFDFFMNQPFMLIPDFSNYEVFCGLLFLSGLFVLWYRLMD